jgi:hypothetical protein
MKRTGMLIITLSALVLFALPAWAAKPSVVAKVTGEMHVVRVTPDSHWLAGWSRQRDGKYKMMIVDTDNGGMQDVSTAEGPGGLVWIPKLNRLFYCQGFYNEKVKSSRVRYDIYDPASKDSMKISDTSIDTTEMYVFDPIPAEDGTRVFHVLLDSTQAPFFITYFPHTQMRDGVFSPLSTNALIASEYDLSSDGSKVYWYGHNQTSGKMMIIEWDLENNTYSNIYDFSSVNDPAEDHAFFKVDSPSQQAVTLAASKTDPTLQMTLFSFANPNKLQVTPISLGPNQEALSFDWKGRSGWLSVLAHDSKSKEFLILEVEPLTGQRRELLRTKDEIDFFDYNISSKMYYYSVLDARDSKNPVSLVMRLADE